MPAVIHCDVAIAGGGLSGALIALALAEKRPELDVRLIEEGPTFGGNHLWSFFGSDVADDQRWLAAPLIAHGWKGYDVAFPGHARTLEQSYYSVTSERLDQVVRARIPAHRLATGAKVMAVTPTTVVLESGDRIEAKGVVDARGAGDLKTLQCGWQKFVGRGFALNEPHGLTRPIVMDATVEQTDGYRFVYVLPLSATELFVEDTYYSDSPLLDTAGIAPGIFDYCRAKGWAIGRETRFETGVLPVVMGGNFEDYWRSGGEKVAKAGVRAGLFHATTGYSFPDAVRLANRVAAAADFSGAALHDLTHGLAKAGWRRGGFYRMLDKMLFRAARPNERYKILERFYRLPEPLIARFYAGNSSAADMIRVLSGKPPVPVLRAARALLGKAK